MTTIFSDADLSRAVADSIDASARYWCAYYDTLELEELRTVRREGAIKELITVLREHYGETEFFTCTDFRTVSELILDNSDWAEAGYDARMYIPRNALERWIAKIRA